MYRVEISFILSRNKTNVDYLKEREDKKKWESTHNGTKVSNDEAISVGAGHLAFVFLTPAAEASGFKSV